jgi:hypothetical protein
VGWGKPWLRWWGHAFERRAKGEGPHPTNRAAGGSVMANAWREASYFDRGDLGGVGET